jgi:hypothetical protein
MKRCRFVQPEITRLFLVDVHRRALAARDALPAVTDDEQKQKATDLEALRRRVELAEDDGDFLDVKKELTAGEARKVYTNLIKTMHAGEKAQLEPANVGITKILAYVLSWSFVDKAGAPVPFGESALNNLDSESYAEVVAAIDAHEEAIDAARAARKNEPAGATP